MEKLPEHLGGHLNKTHTDRGVLVWAINKFNIKSMIDIGCGPGDMVNIAKERNLEVLGIDGDFTLNLTEPDFLICDFTIEKPKIDRTFDLAWSVEFLEHVEEKYMDHYMEAFKSAKYIICTAAPPGQAGHHHVNCQPKEYWFDKFKQYGFEYDKEMTQEMKNNSTMKKGFIKSNGMFFTS